MRISLIHEHQKINIIFSIINLIIMLFMFRDHLYFHAPNEEINPSDESLKLKYSLNENEIDKYKHKILSNSIEHHDSAKYLAMYYTYSSFNKTNAINYFNIYNIGSFIL